MSENCISEPCLIDCLLLFNWTELMAAVASFAQIINRIAAIIEIHTTSHNFSRPGRDWMVVFLSPSRTQLTYLQVTMGCSHFWPWMTKRRCLRCLNWSGLRLFDGSKSRELGRSGAPQRGFRISSNVSRLISPDGSRLAKDWKGQKQTIVQLACWSVNLSKEQLWNRYLIIILEVIQKRLRPFGRIRVEIIENMDIFLSFL